MNKFREFLNFARVTLISIKNNSITNSANNFCLELKKGAKNNISLSNDTAIYLFSIYTLPSHIFNKGTDHFSNYRITICKYKFSLESQ